jgi:hypothetical protein
LKQYAFFLHATKTSVLCEFLNILNMHIVNFASNIKSELIHLACNSKLNGNRSLLSLPLSDSLVLFKSLGFKIPNYYHVNDISKSIAEATNTEGRVLYYVTNKGETYGMQKEKTNEYILLRAGRQIIMYNICKKTHTLNFVKCIGDLQKRYAKINTWLGLSRTDIYLWNYEMECFIRWLADKIAIFSFKIFVHHIP